MTATEERTVKRKLAGNKGESCEGTLEVFTLESSQFLLLSWLTYLGSKITEHDLEVQGIHCEIFRMQYLPALVGTIPNYRKRWWFLQKNLIWRRISSKFYGTVTLKQSGWYNHPMKRAERHKRLTEMHVRDSWGGRLARALTLTAQWASAEGGVTIRGLLLSCWGEKETFHCSWHWILLPEHMFMVGISISKCFQKGEGAQQVKHRITTSLSNSPPR